MKNISDDVGVGDDRLPFTGVVPMVGGQPVGFQGYGLAGRQVSVEERGKRCQRLLEVTRMVVLTALHLDSPVHVLPLPRTESRNASPQGEIGTRGPVYCIFTAPDLNPLERLLTMPA